MKRLNFSLCIKLIKTQIIFSQKQTYAKMFHKPSEIIVENYLAFCIIPPTGTHQKEKMNNHN